MKYNLVQYPAIKFDPNLQRIPRFSLGVVLFGIIIFSLVTVNFNESADYIANVGGGALIKDWFSRHVIRGVLFFGFISALAEVINYSFLVNFAYIFFPAIVFYFYSRLTEKKSILWFIIYFNLIILGQQSYLLKMMVAQAVFLGLLLITQRKRSIMHTVAFPMLFHIQAGVTLIGYFHSINRLIVCFFIFFISSIIYSNLEYVYPELFVILRNISSDGTLSFESLNKFSILLSFIYISVSLLSLGIWKDRSTKIVERIIDGSIVVAVIFFEHPFVFNRVLDFIWLLILLYMAKAPLSLVQRRIIIPTCILSTLWAVPFYLSSIMGF